MKTTRILPFLILSSIGMMKAQNGTNKTTVRIKKVEIVNGVRTEKDTSYTTDGPTEGIRLNDIPSGNAGNMDIRIESIGDTLHKKLVMTVKDSSVKTTLHNKVIILNEDHSAPVWQMNSTTGTITLPDGRTVEQVMAESDVKMPMTGDMFVLKRLGKCDATQAEIDSVKESITIYITGIRMCDVQPAEAKALKLKPSTLVLSNLVISPNPSSGKFEIRFQSKQKEEVALDILTQEGKTIYKDNLKSQNGFFEKEIDISEQPKGIYFVRLTQSGLTQVKKIVLE